MLNNDQSPAKYHDVLMVYLNSRGVLEEKTGYYLFSNTTEATHKITKVLQDCVIVEDFATNRIFVIPFNLFVVNRGY